MATPVSSCEIITRRPTHGHENHPREDQIRRRRPRRRHRRDASDPGQEKVPKQHGEYFESLEAVRAALTETRLALLRVVRKRKPKSLAELARIAKRDFKAVYRDVEALRDLGLIQVADRRRGASSPLRSTTTEIVLRIAV